MYSIIFLLLFQTIGNLGELPTSSTPAKPAIQTNQPAAKPSTTTQTQNNQIPLLEQQLFVKEQQIAHLNDSLKTVSSEWNYWELHQRRFNIIITISAVLSLLWFILIVIFIFYLFIRFHWYGGLCRRRYHQAVQWVDNDESIPIDQKHLHYPQNPYHNETFGIPTGTIRAVMSMTLLVLNIVLFFINLYAPPSSIFADRIEYMTTAFLMMIAFYFGTRAVDVASIRTKFARKRETPEEKPLRAAAPAGISAPPSAPEPEIPNDEKPATSYMQDVEAKDSSDVAIKEPDQNRKILSLTTYFETSKKIEDAFGIVTGNFDDMGVSFGCLQWNFGQKSLQPIYSRYFESADESWRNDKNLVELYGVLKKPFKEQMNWVLSIQKKQGKRWVIFPDWLDTFKKLGTLTAEYQIEACNSRFAKAKSWCSEMSLTSERAFSLMFDICVQNGSLFKVNKARNIDVRKSIDERIKNAGAPAEEDRLVIIAEERSKASSPQWINVVLARKLTIARGTGTVNGAKVNLEDFGISLSNKIIWT